MPHDPKPFDVSVTFEGETPKVSEMELRLIEGQLADLIKEVLIQAGEEER